ncbi:MAG TPA: L-seryl-tRNA(Sec) selenium transferase, partial [Syntrophales bacterium]|nr:L-seryl-tRNA(Sec) selenium transferase [Syntrophales bacterium]
MKKQKIDDHRKTQLRSLPKIDEVMLSLEKRDAFASTPRNIVRSVCRSVVEELRQDILKTNMNAKDIRLPKAGQVADKVKQIIEKLHQYRLRKVINATGVILHTNLGRAPLCADALQRLAEIAGG